MGRMTASLLGSLEGRLDDRNASPTFPLVAREGVQVANRAMSVAYKEER